MNHNQKTSRLQRIARPLWSAALALALAACGSAPLAPQNTSNFESADYAVTAITEGPEDEALARLILDYREQLGAKMSEQLNVAADAFTDADEPQNTIGILVADMLYDYMQSHGANIDLFITNDGGIRINLAPGPILQRHVYELMPFDNALVVVSLTGIELQYLCDYIAAIKGEPVSHITFTIDEKKAENIKVGGQPLDLTKTYRIGTSDYLAESGFIHKVLNQVPIEYTGSLMRDALIEGFRKAESPMRAHMDDRIQF